MANAFKMAVGGCCCGDTCMDAILSLPCDITQRSVLISDVSGSGSVPEAGLYDFLCSAVGSNGWCYLFWISPNEDFLFNVRVNSTQTQVFIGHTQNPAPIVNVCNSGTGDPASWVFNGGATWLLPAGNSRLSDFLCEESVELCTMGGGPSSGTFNAQIL